MSLVILSNDASESNLIGQQSSIFKPYAFRNSITSTLEIPENAQVALQSCKICLDGSVGIEGGRRVLYIYLGEAIDTSGNAAGIGVRNLQSECLSTPIRFELFPHTQGSLDVSQEEIAREISRIINNLASKATQDGLRNSGQEPLYEGLHHPSYLSAIQEVHRCEVKRDPATGESDGYQFILNCRTTADNYLTSGARATEMVNRGLDACDLRMRTQEALGGTTPPVAKPYLLLTLGNGVAINPQSYQAATMGTTFDIGPVSLAKGGVSFDISRVVKTARNGNLLTRFMCGLSRVSTTRCPNPVGAPAPSAFALGPYDFKHPAGKGHWITTYGVDSSTRWLTTYFDYAILVSADGLLRVAQIAPGVPDATIPRGNGIGGDPLQPKMVLVDYTAHHGAGPFNVFYDMATNAQDYFGVDFLCSGTRVSIKMINAGGSTTLIDFDAALSPVLQNMKPIDQTAWNLQPIMAINNDLQRGGTATDNAIILATYKPPEALFSQDQSPSFIPSYYTYCMERATAKSLTAYRDLGRRWTNISLGSIPYPEFNAGTNTFPNLRPVFIVAPSGSYLPTDDANTRDLLGFANMTAEIQTIPPWVADAYDGAQFAVQVLNSTNRPITRSTKSVFVRLDNFNQKTMNAGNGNPSRIISHLPRFDGQNETGRLFFEPNTLVYVDLHNPQVMKINQLDVSLVYADETYCEALVGTTVIVLHIRQKS